MPFLNLDGRSFAGIPVNEISDAIDQSQRNLLKEVAGVRYTPFDESRFLVELLSGFPYVTEHHENGLGSGHRSSSSTPVRIR